ncbi:glycosyltransferase [Candidatus Magnetoovum chiemensis]|nr:glycosyltransferase [Candidatus Magnetoovum chiemensis]
MPLPLYTYYKIGLPMFDNLRPHLDRLRPQIVHIASPTLLGVYGLNYARKNKIPAVSSYHTHFVSYFRYYKITLAEELGWRFLRWFHNRCAANYVPARTVMEEIEAQGIKNVDIWSRGIDLKKFSPNFRSYALRKSIGAENMPILLFVGRLVKEKDLDDLVEACKFLYAWGHRFKAVFIGDGPMINDLRERLPDAYFTGFLTGADLSAWFASSDIFVFPSTTETFGNVIQEAYASQVPVVGVRKGGVIDLIEDNRTGFIAEPNNPEDFAKKVQILLNNEALRKDMGKYAYTIVQKNSWENINKDLLSKYENVISRFHS